MSKVTSQRFNTMIVCRIDIDQCIRTHLLPHRTVHTTTNTKQSTVSVNNVKSNFKQMLSIPRTAYRQWRNAPQETFVTSWQNAKYQWLTLISAYVALFGVIVYKQYYQPIVEHPTVKQTLEFINNSTLYKQYCIDTKQCGSDGSDLKPLRRGVYYDGKHSYRKSHLIWKNYTSHGHTVYIACDGINLNYIPKLDYTTGAAISETEENKLITTEQRNEIVQNANWKIFDLRIYFEDIQKCYNYDFNKHQFILSTNEKDLDIFRYKNSSAFIGSLGSEDTPTGITTNSELRQLQDGTTIHNNTTTTQNRAWYERFTDNMTERRWYILSTLVSIPFAVGVFNWTKHRQTEGFRMIKQRLESHKRLQTLFGRDYVIAHKFTGTVNKSTADFSVNVNDKQNKLLGQITVQANNVPSNSDNIHQWRVTYAEVKPTNSKPINITV